MDKQAANLLKGRVIIKIEFAIGVEYTFAEEISARLKQGS